MADHDLEQRLNPANDNHSPHAESELENTVKKGFWETVKEFSLWDWTKIAAVNVAGAALGGGLLGFGALNVLATTGSYVFAHYLVHRKDGFTKNDLQSQFVLGGAATPVIYGLFNLLDPIQNPFAYLGALGLAFWPFTSIIQSMDHLIRKYSPSTFIKGIFKGEPAEDIKYIAKKTFTDWPKDAFKAAAILALPVLGIHTYVPLEYSIASIVPLRTAFRYLINKYQKQRDDAENNTVPAQTPANDNLPYTQKRIA